MFILYHFECFSRFFTVFLQVKVYFYVYVAKSKKKNESNKHKDPALGGVQLWELLYFILMHL